jgi:hypothetical protein
MLSLDFRLTGCTACNQRMLCHFRCSRIAELLMARIMDVSFFDRMLDEVAQLHAIADDDGHPPAQWMVN